MLGNKNQKGFTLIELLVIISIIAFLTTAILLSLQNSRAKARDAVRANNTKQISTALGLYFSKCESYPVVPTGIVLDSSLKLYSGSSGCGDNQGASGNGGFGSDPGGDVFITLIQPAPLPPDGNCTQGQGSNGYTYTSTDGQSYTLTFCLGSATGSYSSGGVKTLTP